MKSVSTTSNLTVEDWLRLLVLQLYKESGAAIAQIVCEKFGLGHIALRCDPSLFVK